MYDQLLARSGAKCELCNKEMPLVIFEVLPENRDDNKILICESLVSQIDGSEAINPDEWRFLVESIWSENPAVQVLSWRMLQKLKDQSWATDTLDMVYLDEETMSWAKALDTEDSEDETDDLIHVDSIGNTLQDGDSVVLTRTLDVKGSTLSAKMGTVVKNIRLVQSDSSQIEGKVNGQQIVILTKYVRKQ